MNLIELKPGDDVDASVLEHNFTELKNAISENASIDARIDEEIIPVLAQLKEADAKTKNEIEGAIANTLVPTGAIIYHSKIPTGYLRCDGSLVLRTQYAALFAEIGTTYGSGDGSTTFALPKLTDNRFVEGYTSAGAYKDAGLPNITGFVPLAYRNDGSRPISGAFYDAGYTISNGSDDKTTQSFGFDASRCSSVYGKSDTVQPKSLTLIPCIKY